MILEMTKEMFVMPDLGDTQLEAFHRLINWGLKEELNDFPEIEDPDQEIVLKLLSEQYYVAEPLVDERNATYEPTTFSSEIYVPARSTRRGRQLGGEQIVYLGSIPLMSYQGTFVVNSIGRVILNQILRGPGIYYNAEWDQNGNPVYTGTIISNWGGKLKLELDGRNRIWVRVRKKRKMSIQLLLLAMGSNAEEIWDSGCYPDGFDDTGEGHVWSREYAVSEFYKLLYGTDGYLELSERSEELREKFFKPRFEIGEIGRTNLNKKLDLDVPIKENFLLPKDVLAATDYSIGIGIGVGTTDDIDHPKHRRIRTAADLLQDQFRLALERLADSMRVRVNRAAQHKRVPTIGSIVNSSLLLTTLKEFFGSHPLSQSLDRTNPLAQVVHKRKLSSLGPGGLTRRTAGSQVRDINPSHYGRVCPIETSEGINAGLVSSVASHASVDYKGSLASPFHRICGILYEEGIVTYVPAMEDEGYRIATGTCLFVYKREWGERATAARYRQEFVTIVWDHIHLRNISPLQYFSVGASLIPFLENNDANRTLMGSNMQRQAVPLLRPEKCIVGTGLEGRVALDSAGTVRASLGGKIRYIDGETVTLASGGETIDINLVIYRSSSNSSCVHQRTGLRVGGSLRKGQILADGGATEGGELALGRNLLIAYMPWEGYNFEDSVLISERPIFEGIYTSIHIDKYEMEAQVTLQGATEVITGEVPHLDDYFLRHLDNSGLVLPGSWVETGDVLVGKITPRDTEEDTGGAPENSLLQAIFGFDITTARETCLKVPAGGRGRIIDARWFYPGDMSKHTRVAHVYVLQERRLQMGDKVAGRHGNKGIISEIVPRQDMPYLQDGTPVDMVLSPLGVPSRMNMGQIFECVLGLAGHFLGRHYRVVPFDERYERGASRKLVYSELFEASERTANPWLFELGNPGKSQLMDGRTGEVFEQPITIGKAYMLKLIHQVDDKMHARSSGPYSRVTQQPLKGRSKQGGQRVGEMEVWALEGFGVSTILHEMLTMKSDHFGARRKVVSAIVSGEPVCGPGTTAPESFQLLVRELRCLALDLDLAVIDEGLASTSCWQDYTCGLECISIGD
uniref:DNA-directed RNA polymerase subunit beta n=1 Tax=Selaginella lyallii TaxID=137159 RepID=A0A481ZJR1_9TRAC|nr:RNA polymerase beta subunit [Selaginella lyallii]QBL02065.1 RNA polymerase beta subunit [Selaginella lyallii]